MIKDIPFYADLSYRPPPRPIRTLTPAINIDFKENSPFQDGVISEIYQRPDR